MIGKSSKGPGIEQTIDILIRFGDEYCMMIIQKSIGRLDLVIGKYACIIFNQHI